ncbi:MAG: prolyl oligopeptidase family protein [Gemmatimonadota bacterium]
MSQPRRRRFARLSRIAFPLALLVPGSGCLSEGAEERVAVEIGPPPETKVEVVADTLAGTVVADPYRWLEDQEAPETRAWIDAENAYTDSVFAQLPGREELRELATRLLKRDIMGTPREKGGRYFFSKRGADQDLFVVYFREGLDGEDQVLLDPHPLSEDHTTSVGLRDVSEDGRQVVYSVRLGGVDETELRVMDVDSREDLADVFPTARYGSVSFTPDGKGIYYSKFGSEEPRIYYHRLGTDPSADREVFGEGYTRQDIPVASLSDDGRWMLVTVIKGSSGPTKLFLKDLAHDGPFVTVIDDGQSRSFAGFAGERLVITTDLEAPNKRVMVADLEQPSVGRWRELIPEREDVVIQGVSPVGGYYFVSYLKDVQPRLAQYDPNGEQVREIDFGTLGSVSGASGEWGKKEAFIGFSSFHVPPTSYRLNVETGERDVWFRSEIPIDTESIEVKQVWYESKDGTRVPMFLVHQKGLDPNGDHPTYLTGYGGFNISRTPGFSSTAAAWVQMGGVYALPNLRGGGEFGEEWHRAGMLENKQNVFDDFIAAAEWLVDNGYTRPERLAIAGGSNGGLLVGAAMTQRPDLFGAVVCSYPLLDMVRYHKFLVARFWVPEYGSSEDPAQLEYILAYSPYQNVEPGTEYPATLFVSGDGDTRVAPLHARKMAALVQAANGGENPILLRYFTKAGHSGGQPVSEQIDQMVDVFSFLRWQVGDR